MTGKEYKLAIRIAGIIDKSFSANLMAANSTLRTTVSAVNSDFTRLDKGFNTVMGIGKKCFSTVATAATVAAVAIGAAVADCTKEASKFEHQMADVTKYVNGLADAAGRVSGALALDAEGNALNGKTYAENYKEMKAALLDLSTQIPMTAEELTQLSAAAGQSGYSMANLFQYDSDGNITGFLKDTAVMGTAMDISADQAGDWAAKWEKAFNMTHEEIMVLADQINYLGANSATTAAEIAQVVNDSASLGQIAGIDVSTTAALADAMLATGVSSDKVATSVKRTITNMVKGTSATSAMKAQWEELGFTAEGVAMAMQNDSIETLQAVFNAIGDLPDYKQVAALSTLFGQWAIEGDAKIVGNMKVFQDALDMVNDPGRYSGSMEREFTIKASTSESIDTMVGNAFRAMKINIGDSFLPIKKEYSQKLIEFIDKIAEKMTSFNEYLSGADGLSKWIKNVETQFPTFQRKFKKFAQPVFSGIMDTGKWIVKNGRDIISVIAGIGAALAAYKIASTIVHIASTISTLNPVTIGILGVVAAIGILVGQYARYKQYEQALVDQSLADHFGSIALSMADIQEIAEYIVGSDSLGRVREALDAFSGLDSISATMEETVAELNKMNWKISIGMELSGDEQEQYKNSINEYVSAAQEYALQSQYAVSLNLAAGFDESDLESQNIVTKINQFYSDKYEELSALGKQLNDAVTDAFNDGLLDIKEAQVIADIQAQMAEVQESLATGEFDAQLSLLGMEYGGNLDAESFQNLQAELAEKTAEAAEAYKESYVKNIVSIKAAYNEGEYLNEEEYQNALDEVQRQYLQNIGELQAKSLNFQVNTIMQQYAEELDPAIQEYMDYINDTLGLYTENEDGRWTETPDLLWYMVRDISDLETLDKTSRKAISTLLESMEPAVEDMEEIKKQYEELGGQIPEGFIDGISSYNLLGAVSGNSESVWKVVGEQMAGSEYYDTFYKGVLDHLTEKGYDISEDLVSGIETQAAKFAAEQIDTAAEAAVIPAVEGMYAYSQTAIEAYCSQGFTAEADVNIMLNPKLNGLKYNNLINGLPGLYSFPINQRAAGGLATRPELTWFAENGPEMAIPIDGSRNAVSLWEQTGRLLGMDSVLDGLELDSGGGSPVIEYRPTLQFYGGTPSREDLTDALKVSQDEFDDLMERYFKTHGRVSFG